MKKKAVALFSALLCSGLTYIPVQARYERWFDSPFFDSGWMFDSDWMDDMMEAHTKAMEGMKARFFPSKEDREAVAAARESLSHITHEIVEGDDKTTITFSGFENLTKDDVKVVKKDNGWFGTITTPVGRLEFLISPPGLRVTSHLEVKKEEKTEAPQKDAESADEKKATNSRVFYSSLSATESLGFKSAVDINTLKAEPVESTKFTLSLDKQKEIVLPIS